MKLFQTTAVLLSTVLLARGDTQTCVVKQDDGTFGAEKCFSLWANRGYSGERDAGNICASVVDGEIQIYTEATGYYTLKNICVYISETSKGGPLVTQDYSVRDSWFAGAATHIATKKVDMSTHCNAPEWTAYFSAHANLAELCEPFHAKAPWIAFTDVEAYSTQWTNYTEGAIEEESFSVKCECTWDVPTEPAPDVTEAPVVTEAPPVVTEAPPVVTEAPPVVTEAPPVVTEAPPVVTDAPPVVTDAPPVVTEAPPVVTEAPPVVTDAPPTDPVTEEPGTGNKAPPAGGAYGDPHIRTWAGEHYEYHGLCDLVLVKNPGFENGLGMDLHIRNKRMSAWSYIDSAVLRLGEDTLEVKSGGYKNEFWINGVKGDVDNLKSRVLPTKIAGYPIKFDLMSRGRRRYLVDLGNGEEVIFKTFKNMIRVSIKAKKTENFESSVGLMGTYPAGVKMSRDGLKVMDDTDAFGQEWQVLPSDSMLFRNREGAQAPQQCRFPTNLKRRLDESSVTLEEAEIACAHVNENDVEDCVFDVLATEDKDMAGAY